MPDGPHEVSVCLVSQLQRVAVAGGGVPEVLGGVSMRQRDDAPELP
jgi:hypothetical protein